MPPVCPAAVGAAAGVVAGCSVRLCGLQCAGLALEKFRNFLEGTKNNLPILATKRPPPPSPLPDGLCCCFCLCCCCGRSCTAKRAPQAEPALCPSCTGLLHCTARPLPLPLLLLVGRVERTRHPLRCGLCCCCCCCCCLCSLRAALVGRAFRRSVRDSISTQPAVRLPCSLWAALLRAGTRAQSGARGAAWTRAGSEWQPFVVEAASCASNKQASGARRAHGCAHSLPRAHRACCTQHLLHAALFLSTPLLC